MTKCKNCEKEIYEDLVSWVHKFNNSIHCYKGPVAEPIEEWVTPTEGPKLPEVEVRDFENQCWTKDSLIRVDHSCCMPYFVNVVRVALWFKQCRMRKESV
jgi:hypothetical protein